jgi:hypothetical protein
MNALIQKFAECYNCNVVMFGSLLIVRNQNRAVKLTYFSDKPEKEQRHLLYSVVKTLGLKQKENKTKLNNLPPANANANVDVDVTKIFIDAGYIS